MLLDIGVFTGRFHPLIVHLPIGFLLLAVFFALLSRKEKYRSLQPAVPLGLLAGCISAAFASVTGYILSQSGDYDPEVLDDHLWAGLLTTALSFFAYLISIKKIPLRIFTNTKSFVVLLLILFRVHQPDRSPGGQPYAWRRLYQHVCFMGYKKAKAKGHRHQPGRRVCRPGTPDPGRQMRHLP
jgi:hypothetical protein